MQIVSLYLSRKTGQPESAENSLNQQSKLSII